MQNWFVKSGVAILCYLLLPRVTRIKINDVWIFSGKIRVITEWVNMALLSTPLWQGLRVSPGVFSSMWSCTGKLDKEKSKHVGLA